MTFWEWLSTPAGVEFAHALIGLIVAATGWIVYESRKAIARNEAKLDNHIAHHEAEFLNRGSTESQP